METQRLERVLINGVVYGISVNGDDMAAQLALRAEIRDLIQKVLGWDARAADTLASRVASVLRSPRILSGDVKAIVDLIPISPGDSMDMRINQGERSVGDFEIKEIKYRGKKGFRVHGYYTMPAGRDFRREIQCVGPNSKGEACLGIVRDFTGTIILDSDVTQIYLKQASKHPTFQAVLSKTKRECLSCDDELTRGMGQAYPHPSGILLAGRQGPHWLAFKCAECGYENSAQKLLKFASFD